MSLTLNDLFTYTKEKKASDLHIIPGYAPTIRVHDVLLPVAGTVPLEGEAIKELLKSILSPHLREEYDNNREVDFGFEWEEIRFRVNYYYVRGNQAAAFRLIPKKIPTVEELNLPSTFHKYSQFYYIHLF